MPLYYPKFFGRNAQKMNMYFRLQKQYPVGDPSRYPIGARFPFRVDVSFGSRRPTRESARLRINTPEAVKNSSSKMRTKRMWTEAGLPHTTPWLRMSDIMEDGFLNVTRLEEEVGFPCVAKLNSSSGGRGMYFLDDIDQVGAFASWMRSHGGQSKVNSYFFERLFPVRREYRLHVSPHLQGRTITYNIRKNVRDGNAWIVREEPPRIQRDGLIVACRKMVRQEAYEENSRRGRNLGDDTFFRYNITPPPYWERLVEQAVEAIRVLGLDFGFVDVLVDENDNYVFSESGSNPGMLMDEDRIAPSITAQAYQQAFKHIILAKAERELGYRVGGDGYSGRRLRNR